MLGPGRLPVRWFEFRLFRVERRERLLYGHIGRVERHLSASLVARAWYWRRTAWDWTLIVAGVRLHYRRH